MYEYFDHTADLGIRVRATDVNRLFADAAAGVFAAIVDGLDTVLHSQSMEIAVEGTDLEYLLFDWLRELLYRFDTDHLLLSKFKVQVGDGGLKGMVWGEPLDPDRHVLSHEVKAITFHGLRVERDADGWIAEFIVDI
jgi:SHS2 domain-containing protein